MSNSLQTKNVDCIALYKGQPNDVLHFIMHWVTLFFLSVRKLKIVKYSHSEIQLNGVCYSSSVRDKGVRKKVIDLDSGKWDIVKLNLSEEDKLQVINKFSEFEGKPYDFLGAIGVILRFIKNSDDKYFCFELNAKMLGLQEAHRITPVEFQEIYGEAK